MNPYPGDLSDGPRPADEKTIWISRIKPCPAPKMVVGKAFEEAFGAVTHVHIKNDLTHGFVHFADVASVEAALQEDKLTINGQTVNIKRANYTSKPIQQQEPEQRQNRRNKRKDQGDGQVEAWEQDESVVLWQGTYERAKSKSGHGFLKPMPDGGGLEDSHPGLERGVYVAKTQVDRFQFREGEVVEAFVRPPKNQSASDGSHWALVRVYSIDGKDADECTGREPPPVPEEPPEESTEVIDESAFEWMGVVELLRKGNRAHAFLRPHDEYKVYEDKEGEKIGQDGVFVREEFVLKHDLLDGDAVHALVVPPRSKPSYDVVKVLDVIKNVEDESVPKFEGILEVHGKGFGFLRPLPGQGAKDKDYEEEEAWRGHGVYIPESFIKRYDMRMDDRLTVTVNLPDPEKDRKSPSIKTMIEHVKEGKRGGGDNVNGGNRGKREDRKRKRRDSDDSYPLPPPPMFAPPMAPPMGGYWPPGAYYGYYGYPGYPAWPPAQAYSPRASPAGPAYPARSAPSSQASAPAYPARPTSTRKVFKPSVRAGETFGAQRENGHDGDAAKPSKRRRE